MMLKQKKIIFWLAGLLLVLSILGLISWQSYRQHDLVVTYFNVGQGDSILIRTPSHHNILIDGGPDSGVLNYLGRALPFYDHTIDLIVLTHAHADHLDGLIPVLERYHVERILYNGVQTTAQDFIAWQNLVTEKHIPMTIAHVPEVFKFANASLEVLYPLQDVSQEKFKDLNDSSVVTRLAYQDTSFLFTGDAPIAVEAELLKQGTPLKSNVLKVGHHGSKYSSSMEFLQAVDPDYAVISSGAGNKFGHPHTITLQKFKQLGVITLRTDELGDITMTSDGHQIRKK